MSMSLSRERQQIRDVRKGAEGNSLTLHGDADGGITEDTLLDRTLRTVMSVEIARVPWMTRQLDDSGGELAKYSYERGNGNGVPGGRTLGRLAVKSAHVMQTRRAVPQRNTDPVGQRQQILPHRVPEMKVLVRIDVCRLAPHQLAESIVLPKYFIYYRSLVQERHDLVGESPGAVDVFPLAKIHVQPETEGRVLAAHCHRVGGTRGANHQACARDDSVCMCRKYAATNAGTDPEVIGVYDEVSPIMCGALTVHASCARSIRLLMTRSAAKYSCAIARAAREDRS